MTPVSAAERVAFDLRDIAKSLDKLRETRGVDERGAPSDALREAQDRAIQVLADDARRVADWLTGRL